MVVTGKESNVCTYNQLTDSVLVLHQCLTEFVAYPWFERRLKFYLFGADIAPRGSHSLDHERHHQLMANLIRSAKSGSDWTQNDLRAFNITIQRVDSTVFFGSPDLPQPAVSQVVLQNERKPNNVQLDKPDRQFFSLLNAAERGFEESAVDDFAVHVFRMMGYDDNGDRIIRTRKAIQLFMCGHKVVAQTDVCVMEENLFQYLLIQEDRVCRTIGMFVSTSPNPSSQRSESYNDPVPQLVAEAIAAFSSNNHRKSVANVPQDAHALMRGITMVGTTAMFYRIPVTQQLVDAVAIGAYPAEETVISQFIPPVPALGSYPEDGMRPLVNRHIVFQCSEAFKFVSLNGSFVAFF